MTVKERAMKESKEKSTANRRKRRMFCEEEL
jgi:hypothetical protein